MESSQVIMQVYLKGRSPIFKTTKAKAKSGTFLPESPTMTFRRKKLGSRSEHKKCTNLFRFL